MKNPTIRDIELSRIQRTPNDRTADPGLVESVREHGILQPVALVAAANGFRPVYGSRRIDAARKAGLASIPATIYPASTPAADLRILTLVENIQRLDASPVEQGKLFAELVGMGLPIAEVARRVGRSPTYISQRLTIATLPDHVRDLLPADFSPSAVALLARLPQPRLVHVLESSPHVAASVEAAEDVLRDGDDLDDAPFDTAACDPCAKREERVCLDASCYGEKLAAHVGNAIAAIRKRHPSAPVVVTQGAFDGASPALRELSKKHQPRELRDERLATGDEGKRPDAKDAILLDNAQPRLVKIVPFSRPKDGRANKPKTPEERERFAAQSRACSVARSALARLDDFLATGKPRKLDEKQLGRIAAAIAHTLAGRPLSTPDAHLVLLRVLVHRIGASVRELTATASTIDPNAIRDLSRAVLASFAADPDRALADLEKSAE